MQTAALSCAGQQWSVLFAAAEIRSFEKLLACSGDFDWIRQIAVPAHLCPRRAGDFISAMCWTGAANGAGKRLRCVENEESETAEGEIVFFH